MDRRMFLKNVSAMMVLAATESDLTMNVTTLPGSKADVPPTKGAGSAVGGWGAAEGVIKLNPPDLNREISLMQALKQRKTQRSISDKRLSLQQLSDLLWAADGINRPDGKRTSPAAYAMYCVDIYCVMPEGIYLYDVAKHELKGVTKGDYRKLAGTQDFVYVAPLNLVYVLNMKSWQNTRRQVTNEERQLWAYFEVGFLAQNISLYCASEGLGTTVRAGLSQEKFGELINVRPEQIVLAQTVGYPKS
jgi:hypothetical protein